MKLNPKIGDYYLTSNKRILKVISRGRNLFICEILDWHQNVNKFGYYYSGCIAVNWWNRAEYQIAKRISPTTYPELFL